MANKKIVVGNMKMNLTAKEIDQYLKELEKKNYGSDVVFCPSALYIPYFLGHDFLVGIQNIAAYEKGAYTGEISATQAKSMKISYAIIGHSERREYFQETDEVVATKIRLAQAEDLNVILCVGESLQEREAFETYKVLKRQVKAALQGMEKENISKVIIAYEPIWAIGTGKVPSNNEIEDTVSFLKDIILELFHTEIPVLYGGSVTDENIQELNKIPNVDGYLVGGASTKIEKFNKIIEVVVTQ